MEGVCGKFRDEDGLWVVKVGTRKFAMCARWLHLVDTIAPTPTFNETQDDMSGQITIKVFLPSGRYTTSVDASCNERVIDLKYKLRALVWTPEHFQTLLYGGAELCDWDTLQSAGLGAGSADVHLVRQSGGERRLLELLQKKVKDPVMLRHALDGADLNLVENGRHALHWAAGGLVSEKIMVDIATLLVADVRFTGLNTVDSSGDTVLHIAAKNGRFHLCQFLLDHPHFTEVDAANAHGLTALHLAARNGHERICKLLLSHERFTSSAAIDSKGRRALQLTAQPSIRNLLRALRETAAEDDTAFEQRVAIH